MLLRMTRASSEITTACDRRVRSLVMLGYALMLAHGKWQIVAGIIGTRCYAPLAGVSLGALWGGGA